MKNDLNYAVALLNKADGLLITAGAGMGVDSGLPDFRSMGGLWNAYPPLKNVDLSFMDLATPDVYKKHPDIGYWFFAHRLIQNRETQPHLGFQILKAWSDTMAQGAFVFTSNVDRQFQKAGFQEHRVYECHGTIHRLQCLNNCCDTSWEATDFNPVVDNENCQLLTPPPTCRYCGGLARQNVLMFDDWHFCEHYYQLKRELLERWLMKVNNLLIIEIGAGKTIRTVRNFSERVAKTADADLIRINPIEANVPHDKFLSIEMNALEALVAINNVWKRGK
ncbi:NAD-dependent deacetylase [Pasteurellaceae bacterium 20609_3]|uniref:SIR2 family NAD-dependent protein deacylase n=1 Tax=Spirabiliibacterium mucosae TaxID=28156 RepID=UPI001AADFA8C|nr:Sir2 family NAD-dependent protein deacetylase [Spirabiliibacterium mucosae]MBE2898467.1 NAD-dependent deacetylase [Spirabiliibacterium mucosae]